MGNIPTLNKGSGKQEVIRIKNQILVVNEDVAVCRSFQGYMQDDNTCVSYALSIVKAMDILIHHEFCLVILNVQPSNEEIVEAIRIIHHTTHTPILALIPPLQTEERIALFHAGVDVCLEKPVDLEACAAQANTLIQRYFSADFNHEQQRPIIRGSELIILPRYRQVTVVGRPLELTRKEFDLLYYLADNQNQVFTYDQLYDHVWSDGVTIAVEEAVKSQIKRLRKKLASVGKNYIKNKWGVGYQFVLSGNDE